jgi:hypothetical protein
MDETTRTRIRDIFLGRQRSFPLSQAANLLGMTVGELEREVADGGIVAGSGRGGIRVGREEMMAAAMRRWEQAVIEEALGDQAASVLPEAVRLVELRARVPRYLRDMLRQIARQLGTSVDEALTRELEGVASGCPSDISAGVDGFAEGMYWPSAELRIED